MPFERPTLDELIARAQADIESKLPGSDARLRRSVEDVLARLVAGAAHELHGYLQWAARQLFPDTAERDYLARHAGPFEMTFKAAQTASGPVDITGVNAAVCAADTIWQRGDGALFVQDADATIVGGVATISVTAQTAGSLGNSDAGVKLSLVTPVTGIDAEGVVASAGLTNGLDEETEAELVSRLTIRKSTQPQGGGQYDYRNWALEVPGVTKAWQIKNWLGPSTVGVMFLVGDDDLPDAPKIAEVKAYIETKMPVTAELFVFAPTLSPVNYNITIVPDTVAIRAAVNAELLAFHKREADRAATVYLSRANAAISAAADLGHHVLNSPVVDQTAGANTIRTLGTVTFT